MAVEAVHSGDGKNLHTAFGAVKEARMHKDARKATLTVGVVVGEAPIG
jgi:hypothetical protein